MYKKDWLHLNDKEVEVFAKLMNECLSLAGKLDGRNDIKRPLTKGCKVNNNNNGNRISCFYTNARSLRNKFSELKAYFSQ